VIASAASAAPPPAEPVVLVTAEETGQVAVVDPAKGEVTATIKVGARPRGLRLSHDGRRLFVAVGGPPKAASGAPAPSGEADAAGLAIVDVAGRKLMRKLRAGVAPFDVDLTPDGRTAFVSSNETNEVFAVNVASGAVKKKALDTGKLESVAIRPDGRVAYAIMSGVDEVYALDGRTLKPIRRIGVGPHPHAALFAPGDVAFVVAEWLPTLSIVDAKKHEEKARVGVALPPATPPAGLQGAVASRDGQRLYVTTGRGRSVIVFDVAKKAVVGKIDGVGAFPRGIAISADGGKLYTANGPSNDVAVIDVASGKVEKRIKVPGAPWGVAVAGK